jgi:hypothetical protein
MDEKTVREHLQEVQKALADLEAEREILLSWHKADEA